MQFSKSLTVPAFTSYEARVSVNFIIPPSQLDRVSIVFPAGCARMVGIHAFIGAVPLFPHEANTYYLEDNRTVVIDDMYVFGSTTTVTFYGWAPATSYEHSISIIMSVLTAEEIAMKHHGYW